MVNSFSNVVSRIAPKLVRRLSVRMARKLIRVEVLAPFYHVVSDKENLLTKHLYAHRSVETFREDMDFYSKNFTFINLHELISHVKDGTNLPNNAIFLSFDDGFKEIYHVVAPILSEKKIPATFFINNHFLDNKKMFYRAKTSLLSETIRSLDFIPKDTQSVLKQNGLDLLDLSNSLKSVSYKDQSVLDKIAASINLSYQDYLEHHQPYLTSSQVKELIAEGFTIGGHSLDHPLYRTLDIEEQYRQTKESIDQIVKQFQLKYKAFAFPFTEVGVSKVFFERAKADSLFDVSFGTRGLINDPLPILFQRFGLEGPDIDKSAEQVMQHNYGFTSGHIFRREAFR